MTFSHAVKFQVADEVYLRAEPEAHGFVTGILFRPTGILYFVTWGTTGEQSHFDFELSTEKVLTA